MEIDRELLETLKMSASIRVATGEAFKEEEGVLIEAERLLGERVTYLQLPNKKRLISWHRHDYKSVELDGNTYFIDGGQEDYIRYSHPHLLKEEYIEDCIDWLREEFEWTQILDKKGKPLSKPQMKKLKDLGTGHIENIIEEIPDGFIKNLFETELKYRENHD